MVLIRDANKPRPLWHMVKAREIILGHDNKIRAVKLKQKNGEIALHSIKWNYQLCMVTGVII